MYTRGGHGRGGAARQDAETEVVIEVECARDERGVAAEQDAKTQVVLEVCRVRGRRVVSTDRSAENSTRSVRISLTLGNGRSLQS